jgi:hypothetical protein
VSLYVWFVGYGLLTDRDENDKDDLSPFRHVQRIWGKDLESNYKDFKMNTNLEDQYLVLV